MQCNLFCWLTPYKQAEHEWIHDKSWIINGLNRVHGHDDPAIEHLENCVLQTKVHKQNPHNEECTRRSAPAFNKTVVHGLAMTTPCKLLLAPICLTRLEKHTQLCFGHKHVSSSLCTNTWPSDAMHKLRIRQSHQMMSHRCCHRITLSLKPKNPWQTKCRMRLEGTLSHQPFARPWHQWLKSVSPKHPHCSQSQMVVNLNEGPNPNNVSNWLLNMRFKSLNMQHMIRFHLLLYFSLAHIQQLRSDEAFFCCSTQPENPHDQHSSWRRFAKKCSTP